MNYEEKVLKELEDIKYWVTVIGCMTTLMLGIALCWYLDKVF